MEGEEGGRDHWVDGQVQEENNEEGKNDGRPQEALQQKEIEGGTNNSKEGEREEENEGEQTIEQLTQETEMEITDSFKSFLDDVERNGQGEKDLNEEIDSEQEAKMDSMDKGREWRGQIRRRTLKVKPNLESARKKMMTKSRAKTGNRYDVLRDQEGENGE